MSEVLLSIIIPFYKVEEYITKCLDSIFAQDISEENYEVICINDCSPDDSRNIVGKYQQKHNNLFLIEHEKNKGLGGARNTGLKVAKGRYIWFIDSDDYIEPNVLKILLQRMDNQRLDALRFNYNNVDESYYFMPKRQSAIYNVTYSEQVKAGKDFITDDLGWACYVWAFIYKTEFLKKYNFLFNESIYFEDVEWQVRVLMSADRVASYDKNIYNYLQRSGSITQSIEESKQNKVIDDKMYIIFFLLLQKSNNSKLNLWIDGMISLTIIGMIAQVYRQLPKRKNDIKSFIKINNLRPFKSYCFTIKQKRDLFLLNISTSLYGNLKK